jgi:hypothetical protein
MVTIDLWVKKYETDIEPFLDIILKTLQKINLPT